MVEDDDDNDDDMGGQADAQPPAEVEQPPGNPPGETAGVGVVDQGEEYDEPIFSGNSRSERRRDRARRPRSGCSRRI